MNCKRCKRQMANIYHNGWYKGVSQSEIEAHACINTKCREHKKIVSIK